MDDFDSPDFDLTEGCPKRARYLRAAKALAEREVDEPLTSVAERAGIHYSTLRKYLGKPEFRALVAELTDNRILEWVPEIDAAMYTKAKNGDTAAAKLLYQRHELLTTVIRDKSFEDFIKRLDEAELEQLEYFKKHDRLPDDLDLVPPEPETVQ